MGAFKMAKTVLRSMFDKPATLMYPVVEREYCERTRGSVDIDEEQCILCGLCARRCPAKAIETKRNTGQWIIHRMKCIQCGECIDVCPKDCLARNHKYTEPGGEKIVDVFEITAVKREGATMAGADVKENLVCDMDLCVFCGLCVKNCPVDALKVDRKEKLWEVDEAACVKCGACIDKCPKKCLDFDKTGAVAEASTEETPAAAQTRTAPAAHDDVLSCNLEECIFCGLCARNCPCDALTIDRKEKIWKVDEETCIKCEACISKCPKECLFFGKPDAEQSQEAEEAFVPEETGKEPDAADMAETDAGSAAEASKPEEAMETSEEAVETQDEAEDQDTETAEAAEPVEAEEDAAADDDTEAASDEPAEEETRSGGGKKSIPVLDVDKCLYCRVCENECPEEAILAEMDDWTIEADKCISCGVCIGVCPAEALKMSHEIDG